MGRCSTTRKNHAFITLVRQYFTKDRKVRQGPSWCQRSALRWNLGKRSLTVGIRCPGWKCCKPRVLTFDEFLVIPPCTTGKHSIVDDTPTTESKKLAATTFELGSALPERPAPEVTPVAITNNRSVFQPGLPPAITPPSNRASPAPPESESDDPSLEIPPNSTCRRKGCKSIYDSTVSREEEKCVYHPGHPIFHEGSKGWSCCKRRVLEFDQFMKIEGCKEKTGHVFVGKGRPAGEEKIDDVR